MAHKLSGDWRSTVIDDSGQKLADDTFHLVIDEGSGNVDTRRSTHRGRPVKRGQAVHRDFDRIEILNQEDSLYEGVLVVDSPGFQMICGVRTLNAGPLFESQGDDPERNDEGADKGGSAGRGKRRFDGQEQVIWVATKP
jgi:hypothetical protein